MDSNFDPRESQPVGQGNGIGGFFRGGDEIAHRVIWHRTGSVSAGNVNIFACSHHMSGVGFSVVFLKPLGVILLGQRGEHTQLPDSGDAVIGPRMHGVLLKGLIIHGHVHMGVDKPGQNRVACKIDDLVGAAQMGANGGDGLAADQNVQRCVVVLGVQQPGIFQKIGHIHPSEVIIPYFDMKSNCKFHAKAGWHRTCSSAGI